MALSLTACGKSQEVKDVEAAITAIGEITLDSASAITNAEKLYNELSEIYVKAVENYRFMNRKDFQEVLA